ncbi:MAG: OmpA family protein [Hyphomonadaceae bacterium]
MKQVFRNDEGDFVMGQLAMRQAGVLALAIGMAACGPAAVNSADTSHASGTICVPAPETGQYFVFEGGKFVPTVSPATEVVERVVVREAALDWAQEVEGQFPDMGYSWMGLNVRRNTATLIGVAPDATTKEAAFRAGEVAIRSRAEGADLNVIDGISIEGGATGVGAALADLDDLPSLEACQKAFADVMEGRNVEFTVGSDVIKPASARLLDAVSGVASICSAYNIEVGGHADSRGDDGYNLVLSQDRADAVRVYLGNKGIDQSSITAVGYGETRPIDTSGTPEANDRNRRTEFTVTGR